MKKVIYIDSPNKCESKPIEITHYLSINNGWRQAISDEWTKSEFINKIVYLGSCKIDGDMFAIYFDSKIAICKGHLNSGTY